MGRCQNNLQNTAEVPLDTILNLKLLNLYFQFKTYLLVNSKSTATDLFVTCYCFVTDLFMNCYWPISNISVNCYWPVRSQKVTIRSLIIGQ